MEIRRQQQPDGDRAQRSLQESRERTVRDSSETVRSTRQERVDLSNERTQAARLKQSQQPTEPRKQGPDSVQISEQARKLSEAETARTPGQEHRTEGPSEQDKGIAKHLRKLAAREGMAAKDGPGTISPSEEDKGIAKHLRKLAAREGMAAKDGPGTISPSEEDKGIAKHLRKIAAREGMAAKDSGVAGQAERLGGLRTEPGKSVDDPNRVQNLRITNYRMGLAAEQGGNTERSERIAGLRTEQAAGRLNSPERIGRAAGRMLGDRS